MKRTKIPRLFVQFRCGSQCLLRGFAFPPFFHIFVCLFEFVFYSLTIKGMYINYCIKFRTWTLSKMEEIHHGRYNLSTSRLIPTQFTYVLFFFVGGSF